MSISVNTTLGARNNVTGNASVSTTNTILDYSASTQFTYTSTQVEFTNGRLALLNQYGSSARYVLTFASGYNADWSYYGGSLTNTISGNVTNSGGKLVMNDAAATRVMLVANENLPQTNAWAIKMLVTPQYSGSPSADQHFLAMGRNGNDSSWGVNIKHQTNGQLVFVCRDNSTTKTITAAWSPTSGTEYELEFDMDWTNGAYRAFKDGTQHSTTATGTGSRAIAGFAFQVGQDTDNNVAAIAKFHMRHLIFYNAVQHTANYTAGYTLLSAPYLTTDPTITQTTGVAGNYISSFSAGVQASGSDGVKFQILVDGTAKYWNGSAWATSDGTYSQSSTAAEINSNGATIGAGTYKVRAVLHSATGATTPTLSSAVIVTA